MRIQDIKITLEMPLKNIAPNGRHYSEDAIKKAIDNVKEIPIEILTKDTYALVGVANEVTYDEDNKCILAKGFIRYGGTSETIIRDVEDNVTNMNIMSIGISSN